MNTSEKYCHRFIKEDNFCKQEIASFIFETFIKISYSLTPTILLAKSAYDKLTIFFIFFPENRICHFEQIVLTEDSLHEMSNPIF